MLTVAVYGSLVFHADQVADSGFWLAGVSSAAGLAQPANRVDRIAGCDRRWQSAAVDAGLCSSWSNRSPY